MKTIFSNNDIEYIKLNYQNMSYKEIGYHLGFSERQIRGKVNNMGLRKNRTMRDCYFKEIDSATKAYWLGFIYADGCVSYNPNNNNYELSIEIHKRDRYLLESFQCEIDNNSLIHNRKRYINFNGYNYKTNTSVLRLYSRQIVRDLVKLDIVPNKTYSEIFPKCNEFFWDFLRGVFDGDGSITKNGDCLKITSANIKFLDYIAEELLRFGITAHIYTEKDYKHNLVITKKSDKILFYHSMYYDKEATKLNRKFHLFNNLYGPPV